jgi:hypothetical protein
LITCSARSVQCLPYSWKHRQHCGTQNLIHCSSSTCIYIWILCDTTWWQAHLGMAWAIYRDKQCGKKDNLLAGLGDLMKIWIMLGRHSNRVGRNPSPKQVQNYRYRKQNYCEEPTSKTVQITGSPETCSTDIRHKTLGLHQQNQHCHYTESPIQNTPIHHECTMVCIQPYLTQRSENSLCLRNYQRKQHQALQQTRKPLKPTSSTTTTTTRKSQTQKKLASSFKELRKTSLDVYPLTPRRVYN